MPSDVTTAARTNVLIINNLVELYGGEHSLCAMVKGLQGIRPVVCVGRSGPLQRWLEQNNVDVVTLDFRSTAPGASYGEVFESRINEILTQYDIDIVHLNKPYLSDPAFVKTMRRLTRARNIPMIMHIRSNEVEYDAKQLQLAQEMDKWVFVSNKCKEEFLSNGFSFSNCRRFPPMEVITNGRILDDLAFSQTKRNEQRQRLGLNDNDCVVGLIGYFHPCKGQQKLVELARRFKSVDHIRFLVIGGLMRGQQADYRQKIKNLIKEYRLEQKVCLTGYIDTRDIICALDIVISLSQTEGFPGVIIEAMAAGRAVIANPVGGIPEMIGNNGAGHIIRFNDLNDAQQRILNFMNNKTLLKKQGESARKRAFELFDHRNHAQKMEELYMNLMMNRNKDCVGSRI